MSSTSLNFLGFSFKKKTVEIHIDIATLSEAFRINIVPCKTSYYLTNYYDPPGEAQKYPRYFNDRFWNIKNRLVHHGPANLICRIVLCNGRC